MFCPQCGAQAAPTYRFCTRCGSVLTAAPALPPEPTAGLPEAAADVYAAFWPRACAFLIDYVLVVLVCVLLKGLLGIRLESAVATQAFFWATVLVLWLYKAVAESSARQATLGKLVFDLKVTSLQGERIGLLRALARNISQALSAVIMYIGFLMPAFTRRHQALHDMIARTLVARRQYAAAVIAAVAEAAAPNAVGVPAGAAGVAANAGAASSAAGPAAARNGASAPPPRSSAAAPQAQPRREARTGAKGGRAAQQTNTVPVAARPERGSSRPELPLRLSFRDALIGPDKRAVLENLSDNALEVVLDVKSPVTGAHFSRTFVINPRSFGQIGRAQGWPFAPGQLVTVSNPEYRPLVQTVKDD
jgi:uncharacterized RDD family membrane protein YckC